MSSNETKYIDIKTNIVDCLADIEVVNFLLDNVVGWREVLIERHHKFVDGYFKYKKNMSVLSKSFNYTEKDMLRIFWRIQRKLMMEYIELAAHGKVRVKNKPERFNDFLMWQLEQFRDDAVEVFHYIESRTKSEYRIDGVTEFKAEKIKFVLKKLEKEDNLESVLPEHVYPIAKDLLSGKKLTQVIKDHNRSLNYIVSSIIGVKNPRSKIERGWLAYLDDKKKMTSGKKILDFPKKAH